MAYDHNMTIPNSKHGNLMAVYWSMLKELESNASNVLERRNAESFYNLWNELCSDNKSPYWVGK